MSMSSIDGLVSGLKTSDVIRQLMQVEAIPKQRLQIQVNRQAADIRAYQALATVLKKLDDAATAVAKPTAWTAFTAATDGTSLTATARAGAPLGTTSIEVTSLATPARWTSTAAYGLDDDTAFGTNAIQVTKADGSMTSVTPASGSMRDVMASINGAEGLGVKAVAVRVSENTYRLQLVATETGTAAAPTVSGLAGMQELDATDATWSIGEITGRSGSNTVTDLVSGVDVVLKQIGTTTVTVGRDNVSTGKAVEALVSAVNDALAEIKKQTLTDPTAANRGPLASDSMVRGLTANLLRAVTGMVGDQAASAMGLQSTRDGTITLDKEKLTAAIAADPASVRAVFGPPPVKVDGKDVPAGGIADRLRAVVTNATDVAKGFITSAVQGRETTKKDLETQIISWERRLELRQSSLQRQFSSLEVALGKIQSQGNWLSGQLAGMYRSNS